jgi:hypothetical protein
MSHRYIERFTNEPASRHEIESYVERTVRNDHESLANLVLAIMAGIT